MSRISEIEQRLSKRTQAGCFEDFLAAAPSDLAYLLEQVKWIPVEERMPEIGKPVLTAINTSVPSWVDVNFMVTEKSWSQHDSKVTHWKPLGDVPDSEGGTK